MNSKDLHLDSETRSAADSAAFRDVPLYALTVAWHPDWRRVGERAALPALLSGRDERLSRREPLFCAVEGGEARPLADPHLSRTPIVFRPVPQGLRVETGGTALELDGAPLKSARTLVSENIDRGIVLRLEHVVLVLHRLDPIPPQSDDLDLVGASAAIEAIRRSILKVADLPYPVLLTGPTGTGKELVARAIHKQGMSENSPWIAVNLGALPPDLAASELFGAARGAYTGAHQKRKGAFAQAAGGTLFLDEVGAAPTEVQTALLRTLETGEVRPLGGSTSKPVDTRVIAATDSHLESEAREGRFHAALFHRLAAYRIRLPSLRERRDDIGRLLIAFLHEELGTIGERYRLAPDKPPLLPARSVVDLLLHSWPGNVRELRNAVRRLVVDGRHEKQWPNLPIITPPSLAVKGEEMKEKEKRQTTPGTGRDTFDVTLGELRRVMLENKWKIKPSADALGLKRPTLYDLMNRYGVRRAKNLNAEEILEALRETDHIEEAAMSLEVSVAGLKRRMKELGLS